MRRAMGTVYSEGNDTRPHRGARGPRRASAAAIVGAPTQSPTILLKCIGKIEKNLTSGLPFTGDLSMGVTVHSDPSGNPRWGYLSVAPVDTEDKEKVRLCGLERMRGPQRPFAFSETLAEQARLDPCLLLGCSWVGYSFGSTGRGGPRARGHSFWRTNYD
jgi:hypothetical protein